MRDVCEERGSAGPEETLKAELTRRDLAEHMAMLAEADDPERLAERARARSRALSAWKTGR